MNIEQKKNFLINTVYFLMILAACYLVYKYILPIIIPFLLGLIVAYIVVFISKKLKLEGKWIRLLLTLVFYATFGLLITFLVIKGITLLKDMVVMLPSIYENQIAPTFEGFYREVLVLANELDPSVYSTIEQIWENLLLYLSDLVSLISKFAVNIVSGTATAIPSMFLNTLMMIISSFFFAADYENILSFYNKHITQKWKKQIEEMRSYLVGTIFVVLRSYILIMLLTFTELSILFMVFRISNGMIMAFIIAVFDIMPVLGSGGILLPWAIIAALTGNYLLALKLIAIYFIITVIRHYVEPRIVGGQLGLHPIISLISMFIGLNLFGILGMFGFPVAISFFWKKHKEKLKTPSSVEQE